MDESRSDETPMDHWRVDGWIVSCGAKSLRLRSDVSFMLKALAQGVAGNLGGWDAK